MMRHKHMMKKPRNHAGLAWEEDTLSNEFIDVNRLALDDKYGKVAAPLSKRRNGIGPTDGKIQGLFGVGHIKPMTPDGEMVNIQDEAKPRYADNQLWLSEETLPNYIDEPDLMNQQEIAELRNRFDEYTDAHANMHTSDYHRNFHIKEMRDYSPTVDYFTKATSLDTDTGVQYPSSKVVIGATAFALGISVAVVGVYHLYQKSIRNGL
tara:strand:- start:5824 stop:6447 length:624 start_codon:yes stop_codon:yes gene_type:complete